MSKCESMLNIYLFSALAVSADNQCSRGESYWCSDIRIAKRCGAVQHCVDTVWKNNAAAKVKMYILLCLVYL